MVQASSSCSFSSAKLCWETLREFSTNKTSCVLLVSIQWITCKRANVTVGHKTWYCISICVKCANDSYPPFTSCHACPSLFFSVSTCWKKLLTRGKYLLYLVLTYFDSTCFLLNQCGHVKAVCFFPLSISDKEHSRINKYVKMLLMFLFCRHFLFQMLLHVSVTRGFRFL